MIKRIRFVFCPSARESASVRLLEALPHAWAAAAVGSASAPPGIRPVRVAAGTTVDELSPDSPCDAMEMEWFEDDEHLERFDRWARSDPGSTPSSGPPGEDDTEIFVAEEVVMRGADWLEQRWRNGGEVLKQMALAKRAAGLSPVEFSERWKGRAGTISTGGGRSLEIPDAAKGRAYIQNHPRPRVSGEWAYDAVNEVYFDDLDALRLRIDWFSEHLQGGAEADLVRQSWFVVFREFPLA